MRPVILPLDVFPDIVAISPVNCVTTELTSLNPVTDSIAHERMTNIANIVIAFTGYYEFRLIYLVTVQ
jgi:hypothetical protein